MKPTSILVVAVSLLAIGSAVFIAMDEPRKRKPYPKPTPPPPPSPIYHDVREPVQTEDDIAREAERHVDEHLQTLRSALVTGDRAARGIQFLYVLPELMQLAPERVTGLLATLPPGEARDLLRTEMTRELILDDPDAAIRWIRSLEDDAERRDSARIAVSELGPLLPGEATRVAAELGVTGHDHLELLRNASG